MSVVNNYMYLLDLFCFHYVLFCSLLLEEGAVRKDKNTKLRVLRRICGSKQGFRASGCLLIGA